MAHIQLPDGLPGIVGPLAYPGISPTIRWSLLGACGRYLGLRCRAPSAMCQLRENELLKDTGERRLTKSD
jgi:hypothetical protein